MAINELMDRWREEQVPIVNGIIFPDGAVRPVDPVDAPRSLPLRLHIHENRLVRLDNETPWTGFNRLADATDADLGLTAVVGECGYGGDGCIALFEGDGTRIRWLAFFDFSNPFEWVSFQAQQVVARNNLGELWRIPIEGKGAIAIGADLPNH